MLVAGRVLAALAVSAAVVAVVLAVGRVAFGAAISPAAVPALLVALVAGAISFACLGYALATAIRSADAAQPAVQALLLPLLLGSGVLVPADELPGNVRTVASVFPVERLADAFRARLRARRRAGGCRPRRAARLGRRGPRDRPAALPLRAERDGCVTG